MIAAIALICLGLAGTVLGLILLVKLIAGFEE